MLLSGAWAKVIREKNLKQKISWHCPFNCGGLADPIFWLKLPPQFMFTSVFNMMYVLYICIAIIKSVHSRLLSGRRLFEFSSSEKNCCVPYVTQVLNGYFSFNDLQASQKASNHGVKRSQQMLPIKGFNRKKLGDKKKQLFNCPHMVVFTEEGWHVRYSKYWKRLPNRRSRESIC